MTRVGDADPVEHPAHYELSHPGLECIDLTAGMSFCMGNAVKYVWRYRSKNKPVEDLRKALWYTHYAENRNEPVALTCRQLGIINALQHQSQTEQYEFQFWNALRFGDYPKMCRAIALMIRLVEGKNIDDINQELESRTGHHRSTSLTRTNYETVKDAANTGDGTSHSLMRRSMTYVSDSKGKR